MAYLLYHEKQVAALCGVHCINTLLQGPIFSEVDLAQIAHELDAMEKAVMQEGGMTSDDYIKFAAEESSNVAADGMFSIQVLSKALDVWGLSVTPLSHPDMRAVKTEPQNEAAFICNLQEHWFTVRSICGDWWNLNSLFPAPQPLGTFYLSAFLGSLEDQGYQIFVVRGELPASQAAPTGGDGAGSGQWLTPEQAKAANVDAERARQNGKVANALENALSAASAAGGQLQLRPKRARDADTTDAVEGGLAGDDADADLAAAIAASLAGSASNPGPSASQQQPSQWEGPTATAPNAHADAVGGGPLAPAAPYDAVHVVDDEDADLAAAIAASLAEQQQDGDGGGVAAPVDAVAAPSALAHTPLGDEPPPGDGVVQLALRLPCGRRVNRRFRTSDQVSQLYSFAHSEVARDDVGHSRRGLLAVSTTFPPQALPDAATSLQELGLNEAQLLHVAKRTA